MFYMVCKDATQREQIIEKLKENDVLAVFHYLSLHKSPYYKDKHDGRDLVYSDHFSDCLVRLPLFYELSDGDIELIVANIISI